MNMHGSFKCRIARREEVDYNAVRPICVDLCHSKKFDYNALERKEGIMFS
jgi:hypothetical protein